MSRLVDVKVTVTIDGDERDVFAHGYVDVAPGLGMGGSWGATLDGDIELRLGGEWCPIDSVNLGAGDLESITDALCDAALEDDGGVDADEYEAAQ